MKPNRFLSACRTLGAVAALAICAGSVSAQQITAFQQVLAAASAEESAVGTFYRTNGYQPIWTGPSEEARERRAALFDALDQAALHGLPVSRYDVPGLRARMASARTMADVARVEAELSETLVEFAANLQFGALTPGRVVPDIRREVPYTDRTLYLSQFAQMTPAAFFRALPPQTSEYRALMKQKLIFEQQMLEGGWGATVNASVLEPGDSGNGVVALRDRLVRMGYLDRSLSRDYDQKMRSAVERFQADHGLTVDGVAGADTMKEINVSMEARLKSVLVAMERERWTNMDRGDRHIWVNLTDFSAKVIDDGKVTFETRSVIGADRGDRRSPEFSDEMEHMVINPSWYVPRSIVTKEYLPKLKRNPNAVSHIEITDSRGRRVNRNAVNFAAYSARSFPFSMRQPPSRRNALGLVKFMFPNKYNIYLHDTPQKALFDREVRAFSHGCIRLAQPFEFAYTLLARQSDDPKATFHSILDTGRETKVELDQKVPVHIVYRTALADDRGQIEYRRDIYGRDAAIWEALAARGVVLQAQGS
ncbi:L,D-transpeptidase family protein [Marinibacterium profundimaris]|uniref:L,D-transpeptidase family protein n=1 Tax=Marinibacterium profundimaris TaxID=1679460 RepID=UPI000B521B97|nr:L,D-transpeptidase family protein [Marinibacterium profundimaris]